MPDDVSHNDISWWSADWCEMMCRTDYQYWRSSRRLRLSVCLTRFLLSWGKQPAASLRQLRFLLRCLVLQTHGRGYVHLLRGVGVVAEGLQFAAGMKTSGRTESLGGKSAQRNNTLDRELSYTQRSEKTWRDVRHDNDKYWSAQDSPADTCTVSYTEKLSGEGGGRRLSSALHRFYPSNINDNTLKCEQVLQLTL